MNRAKIFTSFTFLLAFAFQVSAQNEKPKIVWKNLQEKYGSFYYIKSVLFNQSNIPIYIDCTLEYFEPYQMSYNVEKSDNTRLLIFNEKTNLWDWNVRFCGDVYKKAKEQIRKNKEAIKKFQKKGNYAPTGCKINPMEEFSLNFSENQWLSLIQGDGMFDSYISGKFKFEIKYWWYSSIKDQGEEISESPTFSILQ